MHIILFNFLNSIRRSMLCWLPVASLLQGLDSDHNYEEYHRFKRVSWSQRRNSITDRFCVVMSRHNSQRISLPSTLALWLLSFFYNHLFLFFLPSPPPLPWFQQPFLEVKVLETTKRSRRNLGLDCDEHSTESRCCRYPLTVDFEAFGWDWIIAPKRYKANYCSGQCEYMFMQKYPHTHLVQHANPRGSAGPCCTPTKMSPINMLYFNDKQQIIHGKIPGMVVDRCGCS